MVTNETTLLVLSNPNQAYIAQVALNDKRIPAKELGVLLYLCNMQGKTSPVELVLERFGHERTWWHRCFKVLQELGYAKFHKTSAGFNKFVTIYVVTDDPEYLADYDIEAMRKKDKVIKNMQPRSVDDIHAIIESRLNTPKEPPQTADVKPINPSQTYQNKENRIRQQMRFVNPLTTGQDDYALQRFYLNCNYPIPEEPEEWEEAKKPGMQMYAKITRHYVGWIKAAYINSILGPSPDEKALNLAWMNWTAFDFKPGNVKGILEWYIAFSSDSNAKPWQRGKGNNNGSRYTRNSKVTKQEHGTAPKPTTPTEFVTID